MRSGRKSDAFRYNIHRQIPIPRWIDAGITGVQLKRGRPARIAQEIIAGFELCEVDVKATLMVNGDVATPETVRFADGVFSVFRGEDGRKPSSGSIYFTPTRALLFVTGCSVLDQWPIYRHCGCVVISIDYRYLTELVDVGAESHPSGSLLMTWNDGGARGAVVMRVTHRIDPKTRKTRRINRYLIADEFNGTAHAIWASNEQAPLRWFADNGDFVLQLPASENAQL